MNALANDDDRLDGALFQKIAEGEKKAFQDLYETASRAVYGYALSLLKNREDAEDVMQDTFLRIHQHACRYKEQGKPMAWILTITRNLAYRKLQERQRCSGIGLEEVENKTDFSHIGDMEQRLILEAAFTVLSDRERQAVVLHAVAGMKHREISMLQKLPLSTVLSCYNRAIRKLKRQMQEKQIT